MCCSSITAIFRSGIFFGFLAFVALLTAFVSGSWVYTNEPVQLPNSEIITSINFKIGLWRICPSVKKVNFTNIHIPSPACILVKYSGWKNIQSSDLGVVWSNLELAPVFVTQMRSCTVLTACALSLVLLAFLLAILGQCHRNNLTMVASGLFLLGGLTLGGGLILFATILSGTFWEAAKLKGKINPSEAFNYDYHYGWSFIAAVSAYIMTILAAFYSETKFLQHFPSVDEMVRSTVPGAERKMKTHLKQSLDFVMTHRYSPKHPVYCNLDTRNIENSPEYGPLLRRTPPDVCSTNQFLETTPTNSSKSSITKRVLVDHNIPSNSRHLYGQTVPIQIKKNHNNVSYCNTFPHSNTNKYCSLPRGGILVHEGFLAVSELESSSSNNSSTFSVKSKTLQHPKTKKTIKFEGFQCPESDLVDFSKEKSSTYSYSGSAV